MSGDRPIDHPEASSAEPSADDVEAFVRSVQAKEAATSGRAVTVVPTPPSTVAPVVAPSSKPEIARARRRPDGPGRALRTASGAHRPMRGPTEGLIGRLEWDRLVADESERQRRYGRPSAIVLLELEGLDAATARTGAGVVGRVVPPCAEALVSISRASDRVTRLRDGRFGVLLRETDAAGASRYATRAIATCEPWLTAMPWPLRMVAGWAAPEVDADLLDAVGQAEQRLRAASEADVDRRS